MKRCQFAGRDITKTTFLSSGGITDGEGKLGQKGTGRLRRNVGYDRSCMVCGCVKLTAINKKSLQI